VFAFPAPISETSPPQIPFFGLLGKIFPGGLSAPAPAAWRSGRNILQMLSPLNIDFNYRVAGFPDHSLHARVPLGELIAR
jgi:hypothetical protein